MVTVLTLRKWDGGWQDQGQVLSKNLGPITSLGLGAWLKAEAHSPGRRSRPPPLRIGPPGGAGAAVIPPPLSGDAASHPWPGRPRGRGLRPAETPVLGRAGRKADFSSSRSGKTGKTEPELSYGARPG